MKKFFSSMTNQIMIAMILGMIIGLLVGPAIAPIKVLGDIFLRLIQMSVVVLIMGAVIEAVGSLDPRELGRLGGKMFAWFMGSTLFAAAFGILGGYLIKPGQGLNIELASDYAVRTADQTIPEMITNFFPTNIIESMASGNMIQVIVFALLFGLAISFIVKDNPNNTLLKVIVDFNEVILQVVKFVMKMAPIGIFALLAWVTGTIGVKVILPLVKFLLVFAVCAILHLIFVVFVSSAYVRANPLLLFKKLRKMTIMAFTTTSSAITLPTKMEDSENKLGVSKRISNLVNPLGMALNSNGLSMYLALACITLAQFYGQNLSLGTIIQVVVLSTLACLGTVVVPGGGLVALAIVVPAIGLPPESIALLAGIDWFSGMFRTVLNVDIDALVSMLIAHDENELDRSILENPVVTD